MKKYLVLMLLAGCATKPFDAPDTYDTEVADKNYNSCIKTTAEKYSASQESIETIIDAAKVNCKNQEKEYRIKLSLQLANYRENVALDAIDKRIYQDVAKMLPELRRVIVESKSSNRAPSAK